MSMTCVGSWPNKCPDCNGPNGGGWYCDACKAERANEPNLAKDDEVEFVDEDDLEEAQTDN